MSQCSDDQLAFSTKRCMDRCSAGEHWPPDLAEFSAIAGEYSVNPLGLGVEEVMTEYWRYIKHYWKYDTAEDFPWAHPVYYQVCTLMRREGAKRHLSQAELTILAKRQLDKWVKHVEKGFSIPPVRTILNAPVRPVGSTPAQQLAAGQRYVK
ncbi:replication protein [Rouxiella sp. S1S-2]|uniref:replication protein P n=1 Tax=Rouxiella sp. S1S-2 TaxID=2653856 RepID=UPI001264305A|nr:replication protein P [Rouxiella sp. S1S-2]KAB7895988.1 replication protein [Rouxiella sp. S1S-2]